MEEIGAAYAAGEEGVAGEQEAGIGQHRHRAILAVDVEGEEVDRHRADCEAQWPLDYPGRHDERPDRRRSTLVLRLVLFQKPAGQRSGDDLAIGEDGVARDMVGVPMAEGDANGRHPRLAERPPDQRGMVERDVRVVDQRLGAIDDGVGAGAEPKRAVVEPVRPLEGADTVDPTVIKGIDGGSRAKDPHRRSQGHRFAPRPIARRTGALHWPPGCRGRYPTRLGPARQCPREPRRKTIGNLFRFPPMACSRLRARCLQRELPPMTRPAEGDARLPTFADVRLAAERIEGVAHRTPVLTSRTADLNTGARLFFKAENLQRAGAFKFRGASNAIAALSDGQRAAGVVTFSSGNHAQSLAYAAKLQGVAAAILMPLDAPAMKVAATKGYGAEVIPFDRYREDREALGRRLAAERGLTLIPPYDHPDVIAGQGTAATELIEEAGALDILLVCLGGGGLLAGCALAAKALLPSCRVIGVEPEAGDDGRRSLRSGGIVHIPVPRSIADGALTTHVGHHNFPIIQANVEDIVTVSDRQLVDAMRFFAERMKMVVEPTGCLAAAAALSGIVPCAGKRVGIVISGGNIDLATFAGLVAPGPAPTGMV